MQSSNITFGDELHTAVEPFPFPADNAYYLIYKLSVYTMLSAVYFGLLDQFDLLSRPMLSEDDDTFQHIARAYSYKNTNLRFAQCPKFKDGITNGAAWYPSMGM